MSDKILPPDAAQDFLARYAAYEARAAELNPLNKAKVFALLAEFGVTRVVVTFDGFGDSGQIEDIAAFSGDEPRDLPPGSVELLVLVFHANAPAPRTVPLHEAIETLAYGFLEQTHAGWENNEGAYGEFVFDVAEGQITLDYNERIETSEHFGHTF